MKRACGGQAGSIAACCTIKQPCPTSAAKLSDGMGSSIDIEPFPADARLPRDKIAQLDRLYLAVTQALDQLLEGALLKAA